jgi:hypothetical protein
VVDRKKYRRVPVFETKAEVRDLPDDLLNLLLEEFAALNMTVVEAKNSVRPQSSSEPSLRPSEEGESTPSIPVETSTSAPGT